MPEIEGRILDVIRNAKPKGAASVTLSSRLDGDLGITSLDLTEVVFELEDAFDIRLDFDAASARKFQTVGDVVFHVKEAVARKA